MTDSAACLKACSNCSGGAGCFDDAEGSDLFKDLIESILVASNDSIRTVIHELVDGEGSSNGWSWV